GRLAAQVERRVGILGRGAQGRALEQEQSAPAGIVRRSCASRASSLLKRRVPRLAREEVEGEPRRPIVGKIREPPLEDRSCGLLLSPAPFELELEQIG